MKYALGIGNVPIGQKVETKGNTMKITKPTIVKVHGWCMLEKIESGTYRVEPYQYIPGNGHFEAYAFYKPNGRKMIVGHYAGTVDSWIRDPKGDLNYIEICGSKIAKNDPQVELSSIR